MYPHLASSPLLELELKAPMRGTPARPHILSGCPTHRHLLQVVWLSTAQHLTVTDSSEYKAEIQSINAYNRRKVAYM